MPTFRTIRVASGRRKRTTTRRRTGRNRTTRTVTTTGSALIPVAPPSQRSFKQQRLKKHQPSTRLSEAGLAFLKCCFASPDFSVDPGKGIPDQYHGRTLSIKDCATTPLVFNGATGTGTDTYIVVAPIPGYSYFRVDVPTGTAPNASMIGVHYPTYTTNFGAGNATTNNFSKFRYASLAAGLYPTVNYMSFSGSVQVWKAQMALGEVLDLVNGSVGPDATQHYVKRRLQGAQSIQSLVPRDNYSQSFIKGCYTFATSNEPDFDWSDFTFATEYTNFNEDTTPRPNNARNLVFSGAGFRLPGFGNLETIIIKISTPPDISNTALLKTWNCIELQPNTDSSLYQFSGVSPMYDPLALELYSKLKERFPVAVCCEDNAKFWDTVLRVIQTLTRAGSYIPGPLGVMSGGLSVATDALAGLVL